MGVRYKGGKLDAPEEDTTSVGLDRPYRNKLTFFPSEPASWSEPRMQNLILGSSDPSGGIDEDSSKELRHGDCISDDESSSNIKVLDTESTSVVLRSLHRNVHIRVQATTGIMN